MSRDQMPPRRIVALVIVVFVFSGCGNSSSEPPPQSDSPRADSATDAKAGITTGNPSPASSAANESRRPAGKLAAADTQPRGQNSGAGTGNSAAENPTSEESPKSDVRRALHEAIAALEAGDRQTYYLHFAPIRQLWEWRTHNGYYQLDAESSRRNRQTNPRRSEQEISRREQRFARVEQEMLAVLKRFIGCQVEFEAEGLLARISAPAKMRLLDGGVAPNTVPDIPKPEDDQIELVGYGDDLAVVLESAIRDLENRDLESFIGRLFSAGELGRLKQNGGKARLIDQVNSRPEMIEQMLRELKAAQEVAPEINFANTLATFMVSIPAPVTKTRTRRRTRSFARRVARPVARPDKELRFQKVAGSWRFYDNSTPVRREMARQALRQPPELEYDTTVEGPAVLLMEKVGAGWRIAAFKTSRR